MKIYVASSWRNTDQPFVVAALRAAGHEVYDFRNPKPGDDGFRWRDVGLPQSTDHACKPSDLRQALKHPRAVEGFASDFGAMQWADACVLLLPCGRSAHLEAGWMAGAGKPTLVLAPVNGAPIEPELMYGLTRQELCLTLDEVLARLELAGADQAADVVTLRTQLAERDEQLQRVQEEITRAVEQVQVIERERDEAIASRDAHAELARDYRTSAKEALKQKGDLEARNAEQAKTLLEISTATRPGNGLSDAEARHRVHAWVTMEPGANLQQAVPAAKVSG